MNVVIGISVAFLLLLGVIIYAMAKAPEGYEDEKGFHKGKEPPLK